MNNLDLFASERELYQRSMAKVCGRYGLTSMELAILLFLANNPEYDTARDIVEKRHLTKSHVSVSVRSLEEKDYIRKEFRNGDRRTAHLVLLANSKDVVQEGQNAQRQVFAVMTEGFSKEEMEYIQRLLLRVYDNVSAELKKQP